MGNHVNYLEIPLRKYFIYFILSLYIIFPSLGISVELKIGFVNPLKVMETATQVENANKRLEQEFAPRQRKLVSAQQEIKKLEERLAKEGNIMSDAESQNLGRDVRDKKREWQRQQDEFREDYNLRRNEELDKLQKKILEVVQTIAKEEGYDFIFSDGVVWASGRVDITDKVLKRLNQPSRN